MAQDAVRSATSQRTHSSLVLFLVESLYVPLVVFGLAVWLATTLEYSKTRSDFLQDYAAAYSLRHQLPLYGDAGDELSERFHLVRGQYNAHPPTNVVMFLPFTLLPPRAAFIVWNAIGLGVFFVMMRAVAAESGQSWAASRTFAAALLLWPPFLANVGLGQTGVVLAAGTLWSWRLLRRGNNFGAGAVLAALTLLKLFPLIFALFLAATRRWRALLSLCVVASLGLALTWLVVGTQTFAAYVQFAAPANSRNWIISPLNSSIPGTLAILSRPGTWASTILDERVASIVNLSVCTTIVVITAGIAMNARHLELAEEQSYIAFGIAMLLISPLTWSFSFVVVIWPAATVVRDVRLLRLSTIVFAASALLALTIPEPTVLRAALAHYHTSQVPMPVVLLLRLHTLNLLALWLFFSARAAFPSASSKPRDNWARRT